MRLIANQSICPIGLGAMPLSINGRPSEKDALVIIETFLELGGNFIDIANVYGMDDLERGHNEKLICKALQQVDDTRHVLVATKGGATRPQGNWGFGEGHPKQLRQACEQSLIHLNKNSHSLYYLHGPDPKIPLEDSIGELVLLKKEGKIQHIGIANVSLQQAQLAQKITPIAAIQNRCNPFCKTDFENGVIDFCKNNNIAYIAYCPFGGWADHAKLATYHDFLALSLKYGVTTYVICLSWLLFKGNHIIPIPGVDKKEQVNENLKALHLQLNTDDIQSLNLFPNLYSPKFEGVS